MIKKLFENDDETFSESKMTPFWKAYYTLGGSKRTFTYDLDKSWRLYKLEALVISSTVTLESIFRRKVHRNVFDFIAQNHSRRVWLYVKHRRWMFSNEYAMHQEKYVGDAPLIAAKTKLMFSAAPEDSVASTKFSVDQRCLSQLILTAGIS